ncbi:MAG: protein kinase [Microcystis aeruginosa Ma_MB_F_20061100_S20]|uniref:non-specific serine/threonine protein kinase n=1 Tax=Microcystis aeruginosa Ma_MB_F_20061100_S20D TaxID=2486253 RepID=A0A552EAY4_MICAE|nr:MAG: protein kinase [Microcystis aeruginosa Ma_MB_F_20061100_S20D]TRU42932.1 MAG: protein kinase [Microcystis aeruginosa Ma_MB_F_20061100_S20]
MSLCLNPDCLYNNNPTDKFCQKCRFQLLLKDRYRAIKLIGQGGFGKTFQAIDEDKPSQPYCVIKQFFPNVQDSNALKKAAELFREEAISLDNLGQHPQIPSLYAYFTGNDGRQYLVQEYIEGQNLEQELQSEGVFNEEKIKHLLLEILPILDFIHAKRVIHRDIKPANIIRRTSDNKIILVDFGASKFITIANLSLTGTVIGSAGYIAPEQGNGKAINSSDLYGLGVTCIYLLTGVSPFELFDVSEHEWLWRQHLINNPVSVELGEILDKLIEFGTKKRYQSAGEVLQELAVKLAVVIPPKPRSQDTIQETVLSVFPVATREEINLKSAREIDYTNLRDLLAQEKWREADQETAHLFLKVADRTKEKYLKIEDIDNFPCEDLATINQLWLQYSQGKFGLSVQKRIYESLGGSGSYDQQKWNAFGLKVGWRVNNKWLYYDQITFALKAPSGHLPTLVWGVGGGIILFSRLETCTIDVVSSRG